MTDTNDPMAEIRASFFIECEELLEALQDGLQQLEDGADDPETINVVFRAVHSIKGGAGAFGLEPLVRFAHRYETVLDEVRAGRLHADAEAQKVFFQAADHLSDLVRTCRDGSDIDEAAGEALVDALNAFLGDEEEEEVTAEDFQPLRVSFDLDLPAVEESGSAPTFRVVFRPGQELFATGNEPQKLLRNLAALGATDITCDTSTLPRLQELAPETPYFTWTAIVDAEIDEAEIRAVFEFVEGLCDLEITRTDTSNAPDIDLPPLPDPQPEAVPEQSGAEDPPENAADPETPVPVAPAPAEPSRKQTPTAASSGAKSIVRVDLERIERLVNLVGELVINQAMLAQSLDQAGLSPHSDAMNGLEEFQRLTRYIQDIVMMIRAQPVKSLFQRMSLIVREASAALVIEVRLTA